MAAVLEARLHQAQIEPIDQIPLVPGCRRAAAFAAIAC
jgi:hypothetical protein